MSQIRLSIGEGQVHARLAIKFVEAFADRALPALSELTDEDMKLIEFVSAARPDHPYEDEWESYERAQETAAELQRDLEQELFEVNQEVLRSAFAGLHHLFERTLQYVLKREDRKNHHKVLEILPPKDRRVLNIAKMLDIIERCGYSPIESLRSQLRKLELIAHAVKHGEGRSLTELGKSFPDLFYDAAEFPDLDLLQLTPELLKSLSAAVSQFWIEFPHGA